jgi:hypothetical protein
MIRTLATAGVDEVACVIDFGVEHELVLESLPRLARVMELVTGQPDERSDSTMEA